MNYPEESDDPRANGFCSGGCCLCCLAETRSKPEPLPVDESKLLEVSQDSLFLTLIPYFLIEGVAMGAFPVIITTFLQLASICCLALIDGEKAEFDNREPVIFVCTLMFSLAALGNVSNKTWLAVCVIKQKGMFIKGFCNGWVYAAPQ